MSTRGQGPGRAPGAQTQTPQRDPAAGARPWNRPCAHAPGRRVRPAATHGHEAPLAQAAQRHPTAQVRTGLPEEVGCPDPIRYEAGGGPPSMPLRTAASVWPTRAHGPAPRTHRESSPPSRPRPAAASRDVALSREGASGTPLPPRRQLPAEGWGGAGKGSDGPGRAVRACAQWGVCSVRAAGPVLVACPPRAAVGAGCVVTTRPPGTGRSVVSVLPERGLHGLCPRPARPSASAPSPPRPGCHARPPTL